MKFRTLFRRKEVDREMSEEMRTHVELQAERNLKAGMNPDEARYAALRQFGNVACIQEQAREQRGWLWLEQLGQDVRHGSRVLAKAPGFTGFALLTLALGIGATTAIFSVVNNVLLRPLPVADPGQLVFLSDPEDRGGVRGGMKEGNRDLMTYPDFQYLREHNAALSGVAATTLWGSDVSVVSRTGQVESRGPTFQSMVSGDYFSVLGVGMALGRGFTAEVDQPRDAHPVAVISDAFWQDRFGRDPAVLGRLLRVNDTAFEIIGVAQPGFAGDTVGWPVGVWLPVSMQAKIQGRDLLSANANPLANFRWLGVIGRLKPGVNLAQAQANIDVTFRQLLQAQLDTVPAAQLAKVPAGRRQKFLEQHVALTAGGRGGSTLRKTYSQPLVVLLGLVGLLLLSACANLANFTLARAARRQKEIALRVALGAKSSRVFRQLLTESLLLSVAGGALGLVLAYWGDTFLFHLVTQNSSPMHLDSRVMLFALGVSVLVGIIFGTAPAFQAWRVDLNSALKSSGEGAARRRSFPLGKILVVLQVALSLPLLVIAGLFVHSFQRLASVDLGYDHGHLLLVWADGTGYKGAALDQFHRDLDERFRSLPGVVGATRSANGLFTGRESSYRISIEGYEPPAGQAMNPSFDHVGPAYFATVGIPILRGREILPADAGNAQRVGLINETMARTYFGDTDPLGRTITVNIGNGPSVPPTPYPFVIVGVVADTKYYTVREKPRPYYYVPLDNPVGGAANPYGEISCHLIRTAGDPAATIAAVRTAVRELAPNAQPPTITTVSQQLDGTLGLDWALTGFSGFFGALAAILVSIGIYGIMSYAVARRTREIGIRIAIGAQGGNVLELIMRESFLLVLAGVMIGIPAALGAGRFVTSFLFGLTPMDPLVLGLTTGLMFTVAAVAAFFPARRAAKVDPVIALRAE